MDAIIELVKYLTNLLIISGIAVFGVIILANTSQALDIAPLSESHKQRIVANCTSAKASLRQLHRSDASLRVNRGQVYEFISTRLMARLNSRLALNRLDGAELVAAAAQYERTLGIFRESYRLYEEQLTAILRMDCTKQPEAFYYRIVDAQAKRRAVGAVTLELERYATEYYQAFERFSQEYRAAAKGMES